MPGSAGCVAAFFEHLRAVPGAYLYSAKTLVFPDVVAVDQNGDIHIAVLHKEYNRWDGYWVLSNKFFYRGSFYVVISERRTG